MQGLHTHHGRGTNVGHFVVSEKAKCAEGPSDFPVGGTTDGWGRGNEDDDDALVDEATATGRNGGGG